MSLKVLVNSGHFTCRYTASFALKIVQKQMQIMKPGGLSILSELAKGYRKSQVFFYSMVTGFISENEQSCLVGALFFHLPLENTLYFVCVVSAPVRC